MRYYNYELTKKPYSDIFNFKIGEGTSKDFGVKMLNRKRKRK